MASFCGDIVRVVVQVSRIQYRRQDGAFFIYLRREYRDLWLKLKERKIPVVVRIEVPEDVVG